MSDTILDLVESLKKLSQICEKTKEDRMPGIAEISLRLEHQKYALIKDLEEKAGCTNKSKGLFLGLFNIAKVFESNIYAAAGSLLDGKDEKSEKQEMTIVFNSMMKALIDFRDEVIKG